MANPHGRTIGVSTYYEMYLSLSGQEELSLFRSYWGLYG